MLKEILVCSSRMLIAGSKPAYHYPGLVQSWNAIFSIWQVLPDLTGKLLAGRFSDIVKFAMFT